LASFDGRGQRRTERGAKRGEGNVVYRIGIGSRKRGGVKMFYLTIDIGTGDGLAHGHSYAHNDRLTGVHWYKRDSRFVAVGLGHCHETEMRKVGDGRFHG